MPKKKAPSAPKRKLRSQAPPTPEQEKVTAVTQSKASLAADQVTVAHGSSDQGLEHRPTLDQRKPTTVSSGQDDDHTIVQIEDVDIPDINKQGASSETHPITNKQTQLGVPTTGQLVSDKTNKQPEVGVPSTGLQPMDCTDDGTGIPTTGSQRMMTEDMTTSLTTPVPSSAPLMHKVPNLNSTLQGLIETIERLGKDVSDLKEHSISRGSTPSYRGRQSPSLEKHSDSLHRVEHSFETPVHNEHFDYVVQDGNNCSPQPRGTGENGHIPSSDHNQSTQENRQILDILQKLADCQVANIVRGSNDDDRNAERREDMHDRRKSSEEKSLTLLTQHSLLKDRGEGKEIQWLLNLNMLREQREWSDERYCRYLPRLWNPEAKVSVTKYFIGLSTQVSKSRIKLDRAFIEKYADGGIAKLLNDAAYVAQADGVSCTEFLSDIDFARKAMNMWNPRALPSEDYIIETLRNRFTSAEMLKLMKKAQRRRESLNLEDLAGLALIADDNDRIERRTGSDRVLRVRSVSSNTEPNTNEASSHETWVRSVLQELSHSDTDVDSCCEEMLLSMAAAEYIRVCHGNPSIRAVAKVMDRIKRAPPIGIFDQHEIKEKGAVCNGPLKHTCKNNHICAWFALKGSCTMPEGRCKHKHALRNAAYCLKDRTGECMEGAYCAYRHLQDRYAIYFYDRNIAKYKKYLWNDRISKFSSYHK